MYVVVVLDCLIDIKGMPTNSLKRAAKHPRFSEAKAVADVVGGSVRDIKEFKKFRGTKYANKTKI
ncbi:hypothetical protein [Vagococcus intermedius]|uniref:Uncharacterized protein n=1 Tax=Vagococcus intermedius TaxID=2991418 RepID=A0AAF0CWY0_9ENTE|nr:hypothetical protein [Vagococcus intermedius]WEG74393.1 hypothetical protein OL234_10535 [Vagococcus intermedius]WEG76514.1 hypothetical protein OL235_10710 [Vagococcus intermedius]